MQIRYLKLIPRDLDIDNIDSSISQYLNEIGKISLSVPANNVLDLLLFLKREKLTTGPYPHSLFEAANRIMTDLTILFGVKRLLQYEVPGLEFKKFSVCLGTEKGLDHDLIASNDSQKLIGEAFNVAQSFFQGKKASSLRKLRQARKSGELIVLLYNADAIKSTYRPKTIENEFHVPVHISI